MSKEEREAKMSYSIHQGLEWGWTSPTSTPGMGENSKETGYKVKESVSIVEGGKVDQGLRAGDKKKGEEGEKEWTYPKG